MPTPRVLILSPTWPEIWKTSRRLELTRREGYSDGRFAGCDVMLRVTGMGAKRMVDHMLDHLSEHAYDWLICAGFAGALNPKLATGDVLMPGLLRDDGQQRVQVPDGDAQQTLLTVDHVVNSVEEKNSLFEQTHADAIDMESLAVALEAEALGLRYTIIRVISDDASSSIPEAAEHWMKDDGVPKIREPLLWAISGWGRISKLRKLANDTTFAAERLSKTIPDVIQQWVDQRLAAGPAS